MVLVVVDPARLSVYQCKPLPSEVQPLLKSALKEVRQVHRGRVGHLTVNELFASLRDLDEPIFNMTYMRDDDVVTVAAQHAAQPTPQAAAYTSYRPPPIPSQQGPREERQARADPLTPFVIVAAFSTSNNETLVVEGDRAITDKDGEATFFALALQGPRGVPISITFHVDDHPHIASPPVQELVIPPCEAFEHGIPSSSPFYCDCAAGYQNYGTPWSPRCVPCGKGYMKALSSAAECVQCQPGWYSDTIGATTCSACPAGTASAVFGSTACGPCEAGTYNNHSGLTHCYDCLAGTVSSRRSSNCSVCPPGTIAPGKKSEFCEPCKVNTFNPAHGGSRCSPCVGRSTSEIGSETCSCEPTTFFHNKKCLDCPKGASCLGGTNRPVSLPGFYESAGNKESVDSPSAVFVKCFPASSCLGGAKSECALGYTDERCSDCYRGDATYYHLGNLCQQCYASGGATTFLVCCGWIVIAHLLLIVRGGSPGDKASPASAGPIVVTSLQISTMMLSLDLRWPKIYEKYLGTLSIVNFNTEVASPECSDALDPAMRLGLKLSTPIVGVLVLSVVFAIVTLLTRVLPRTGRVKEAFECASEPSKYCGAVVMLLHLTYPLMANTALGAFACFPLDDGNVVAEQYPTVLCYSPKWKGGLALVGGLGMIYVAVLPMVLVGLVVWNRHHLEDPAVFDVLGLLYHKYTPDRYMWSAVDYGYKVAVAITINLFTSSLLMRTFGLFFILVFTIGIHAIWEPYSLSLLAKAQHLSFMATTFVLFVGVVFLEFEGDKFIDVVAVLSLVGLILMYAVIAALLAKAYSDMYLCTGKVGVDAGSDFSEATTTDDSAVALEYSFMPTPNKLDGGVDRSSEGGGT